MKGLPRSLKNLIQPSGVGSAPAISGLEVKEQGIGAARKTVFKMTSMHVPLTDSAGVVAFGGLKLYDFPEGAILFGGAVLDGALSKSSAGVNADFDGDVGVGTATASNNATLSSTEQDLIPTTATPQAVAGVTTCDALSTSTEAAKVFDGSGTAKDLFLNFLVDDADHDVTTTPCDLIVTGTLVVHWTNLGDK